MKIKDSPLLSLAIPIETVFIPVAATFAEQAARGLGLDERAARAMRLATEELTASLCRIGMQRHRVTIECSAGSYYVEEKITMPVDHLQLRAFNLAARLDFENEADLDQMGLLIASRMTDRFWMNRSDNGHLVMLLVKEFAYPEIDGNAEIQVPETIERWTITAADSARIKWFARLVNRCYPPDSFPAEFRFPGKLADMAKGGDCQVLVALGPADEMAGGMAWRWIGNRTVELFGPYCFVTDSTPELARDLLEACINNVARTPALALICRRPTAELPDGYLEPLTAPRPANDATGSVAPMAARAARFRLLYEETGAVVWSHPALHDFLIEHYRRLYLPRDIRTVDTDDGESRDPFSVLSCDIDRRLRTGILRPIWPGQDCRANLAAHLELLRDEQIGAISLEMDLGHAWQALFVPGLLELGFAPTMILPHAGHGDLVIFELEAP
jgi:anti-sigma regulatory factor (Ser/Thr protein kinase)